MDARTIDALVSLKADGNRSVYFLKVKGLEFLFRPLTFSEFDTVTELEKYLDPVSVNDTILKMCVLYSSTPRGIANWIETCKYAFVIDHIAQKILDVSGFQNQNKFFEILNEKRKKAQEVQSLIEIYIITTFKTLSSNDVQNMTLEDQLEYFAKSEEALGKPVDFTAIFKKGSKKPNVPRPSGMQSSTDDLLNPALAEKPDFRNG